MELASSVGPSRAREELGYPARRTATRWLADADVDWERAIPQLRGRALAQAYKNEEQAAVGSLILDRLVELLLCGEPSAGEQGSPDRRSMGPDALLRCAAVFERVTNQLGAIQSRGVRSDGVTRQTDAAMALLEASRIRNEQVLAKIEASAGWSR